MKMRSQNLNRHSRRLRQGFSTFGAHQCDQRALKYQNRCFDISNPRISKFQILTFFPFHFSLAHLSMRQKRNPSTVSIALNNGSCHRASCLYNLVTHERQVTFEICVCSFKKQDTVTKNGSLVI